MLRGIRNRIAARRSVALGAVAGALAMLVQAPAMAQDKEVLVGIVTSLSGFVAPLGLDQRDAALLALNQINEQRLIPGIRLRPVVQDDKGDPTAAVVAVQRVLQQGVVAVIGPTTTTGTAAAAPILEGKRIPMIGLGLLAGDIAKTPLPYVFGINYTPEDEAKADFDLAKKLYAPKSIAILHDTNLYGVSVRDGLIAIAKAEGVNVVAAEGYKSTDTDMSPQLTTIRNAKPDVLIQLGGGAAPALIVRQKFELGMTAMPLVTGPTAFSNGDERFLAISGVKAAEGLRAAVISQEVWQTLSPSDPRQAPMHKFMKSFEQTYGRDASGFGAGQGYDSMMILADAIRRAGSSEPAKIRDAIEQTDYQGVLCRHKYSKTSRSACSASDFVPAVMADGKLIYKAP